jgi:hypothetical protein
MTIPRQLDAQLLIHPPNPAEQSLSEQNGLKLITLGDRSGKVRNSHLNRSPEVRPKEAPRHGARRVALPRPLVDKVFDQGILGH